MYIGSSVFCFTIVFIFYSRLVAAMRWDQDVTTVAPLKSRHILELSRDEKLKFLDSFDSAFSDIDGVLWTLDNIVEGASDGFKALKKAGKNVTFITNNSVRSEKSYDIKFQKVNLDVNTQDLIHPAKSVAQYLQSIKFDGLIYAIATERFKNILRDSGFEIIDGPNKILEESYTDLARNVFDKQPVRAVIIDVDFNLSSAKMIRAHLYLQNPDCLLITGASDIFLPVGNGVSIIGPGPYAKILTETTDRKAIQLGKPGKELCSMLIDHFRIENPRRVLMIGDMLEQDVGFGKLCGFQTLLVLSGGCSRKELEKQSNPNLIPDYYTESIADVCKFMNDLE